MPSACPRQGALLRGCRDVLEQVLHGLFAMSRSHAWARTMSLWVTSPTCLPQESTTTTLLTRSCSTNIIISCTVAVSRIVTTGQVITSLARSGAGSPASIRSSTATMSRSLTIPIARPFSLTTTHESALAAMRATSSPKGCDGATHSSSWVMMRSTVTMSKGSPARDVSGAPAWPPLRHPEPGSEDAFLCRQGPPTAGPILGRTPQTSRGFPASPVRLRPPRNSRSR